MRGKPAGLLIRFGCQWNIPAYAGKTTHGMPHTSGVTEHPRVCGENDDRAQRVTVEGGTSPRMRGKRPRVVHRHAPNRNIPAYAGKTLELGDFFIRPEEHPRVCGENHLHAGVRLSSPGTSPRMRGKPQSVGGGDSGLRNIPAYAGKTPSARGVPAA